MNIPALLTLLVGGGITLTAYIVAVGFIFPGSARQTLQALQSSLWRPFLIGLVNLPFFVFLAALLFNISRNSMTGIPAGIVSLIAFGILLALTILASGGLVGLSRWIGERIAPGESAFPHQLRSALLIVLACMAPFVGWFIFTPFVIATALGAGIQVLFSRKGTPPTN